MELVVKTFAQLTLLELFHIMKARQEIFIVEQNCVYQDIDDIDQIATHVFLKDKEAICAYARLYWEEEREDAVKIGRVIAPRRGEGVGLQVMKEAVRIAQEFYRPKELFIHAQEYAIGFYEKAGFSVISAPFMEDDIPHVEMVLPCISESQEK